MAIGKRVKKDTHRVVAWPGLSENLGLPFVYPPRVAIRSFILVIAFALPFLCNDVLGDALPSAISMNERLILDVAHFKAAIPVS
jgi:hypothetical protein